MKKSYEYNLEKVSNGEDCVYINSGTRKKWLNKLVVVAICVLVVILSAALIVTVYGNRKTIEQLNLMIDGLQVELSQHKTETKPLPSNVSDLFYAAKSDPTEYNNKQVSVSGTVCKSENGAAIILFDWFDEEDGVIDRDGFDFWSNSQNRQNIEVVFSNESRFSALESGDYVKIDGMVRVSGERIVLDDCECTSIITYKDRRR